ncbi:FAM63A-like protein [Perilla frutescens var. hirtella]|uniref:FAM63A-like protein n=1 Tax=Perilla frutescens var. hirtella TaxID=608512 RepID=A0AAD4P8N4_PERFH|nr:FAM63A-like protein [Perilla frutescens var. hirtella]
MNSSSSSSPPSTSVTPPQQEAEAKPEEIVVVVLRIIYYVGSERLHVGDRDINHQSLGNDSGISGNVLSLKNSLNLSPDIPEVSQEKLLSLVAERLIDSNSKIDNKDADYVKNQQQNIADAIDLLHRLTTGIDVNIKFRRIDDFEFTPECAIFDLLDIPLYHGWIIDPQDIETADAIGSKSYNFLMGELVSLEAQAMECEQIENLEEGSVDFVAATTAALGVPSPSLSRSQSFTDSPQSAKKGDMEEEAELLRVLKLSEAESPSLAAAGVAADTESEHVGKSELLICSETVEKNVSDEIVTGALISDDDALSNLSVDKRIPGEFTQEAACSLPKTDPEDNCVQQTCEESKRSCETAVENSGRDLRIQNKEPLFLEEVPSSSSDFLVDSRNNEHVKNEYASTSDRDEQSNLTNDKKDGDSPSLLTATADLCLSSGVVHNIDNAEVLNSSIDISEPIYEGEECIMDSGNVVYENQEPIYEGEVVLAEQVDRGCINDVDPKERITVAQGELIRNYMKSSASQLTIYGLFCLLDKVKERELCVFFRNNHFNTMFKYEGELYILATDQGFINQPDLVWEKLNEVNGDTVYVMGNFKDFKVDDLSNGTWDGLNAMASTADYISSINGVAQSNSNINSDLQLAIALQQQEFEQQEPQRSLQPAVASGSGLITGPQFALALTFVP